MLSPLALLRRAPAPVRVRVQSSAAKQHARTIDDLRTPALCCYPSVMEANAQAMLERASRLGCVLRPHVKTAKTLQAAAIQTGGTKRRVVVSTLAEAEFLARGGFDDILYAVPITQDKFAAADELNQRLERFHVMVDHPSTVRAITSRAVAKPLSVVVMVDSNPGPSPSPSHTPSTSHTPSPSPFPNLNPNPNPSPNPDRDPNPNPNAAQGGLRLPARRRRPERQQERRPGAGAVRLGEHRLRRIVHARWPRIRR